jgi:HSP20 family molecular chaperone IbpA
MELPAKSWDPGNGDWSPNCDVSVTAAGLTILVELAGLRSADIDITCAGNRLQIQGDRSRPEAGRVISPSSGEVKFGRFHVVFEFPAGYNLAQSQAFYLNGFLRIEVPAAEGTGRVVF